MTTPPNPPNPSSPKDPFGAKRFITLLVGIPVSLLTFTFILLYLAQASRWTGESTVSAFAASTLALLWGWLIYPLRVFPQLHINTSSILTFLFALVLFTLACHALFSWLSTSPQKPSTTWRFKWTLLITSALTFSLIFTMSLGMAIHQTGWLITRKKPFINPAFQHPASPESAFNYAALANGAHLTAPQVPDQYNRLYEPNAFTRDVRFIDRLNHIDAAYVRTPSGKIYALVVRHRDPALHAARGISVTTPTESKSLPADAWPAIFDTLQAQADTQPASPTSTQPVEKHP